MYKKQFSILLISGVLALFSSYLYASAIENNNISFFLATDHYISPHQRELSYSELYRFSQGKFSQAKVVESTVDELNRAKRESFTFWSEGNGITEPDYLMQCNTRIKCVKRAIHNDDIDFLPYAVTVDTKGNHYIYLMPKNGLFAANALLVSYLPHKHIRMVLHEFPNIAGGTNGNYVAGNVKQNIIWVVGLDHNLKRTYVYKCDFNGNCLLKKTFSKKQVYGFALAQNGEIGYFIMGAPVILQRSVELPTLYKFDKDFNIDQLKVLNVGSPGQPISTNRDGSRLIYADYSPKMREDVLNNCNNNGKDCHIIDIAKLTQNGQHMQAISSVRISS